MEASETNLRYGTRFKSEEFIRGTGMGYLYGKAKGTKAITI